MDALINFAFKCEVIRKVRDVILPLNDIGQGPPFFCVHSVGGSATELRDLVRMLGPGQNFYGIQVPTSKRNAQFGASIREMSKYYVDELVKLQPEGAFWLGGYSIGATIALEMAHQLIARGREVRLLVVFDGEIFNTGAEIGPYNPLYWLKILRNVPRWISDELVRNHRHFANKMMARLKSTASKKTKLHSPHAVERYVNLNGILPDHAAFIKALYDSHRDYVPSHYPGHVLVFAARTHELLRLRQVSAAWIKIAPLSEIFGIPGTHLGIMKMPRGLPVAELLSQKIREGNERL